MNAVANVAFNRQLRGDNPEKLPRVSHPGTPLRDRIPLHLWELVRSYGPSGRLLAGAIEAIEGIPARDTESAKALPLDETAQRYIAGLRTTLAEDDPEQQKRIAPILRQRCAVAVPFAREAIQQARTNPTANPFGERVAQMKPTDARTQAQLTERYLIALFRERAGR